MASTNRVDRSRKPSGAAKIIPLYIVDARACTLRSVCHARREKGETLDEYLGDRITPAQATSATKDTTRTTTTRSCFIVDKKTSSTPASAATMRASSTTSADPNCESEIKKGRVFIVATRKIARGEELGYDYQIGARRTIRRT